MLIGGNSDHLVVLAHSRVFWHESMSIHYCELGSLAVVVVDLAVQEFVNAVDHDQTGLTSNESAGVVLLEWMQVWDSMSHGSEIYVGDGSVVLEGLSERASKETFTLVRGFVFVFEARPEGTPEEVAFS
jgi:hypothetical protein